jgi:hypothetical protein
MLDQYGRVQFTRLPIMLAGTILFLALSAHADSPVTGKIAQRNYPSVFQAWNKATPLPGKDADTMLALHDLAFLSPSQLGLKSEQEFEGIAFNFSTDSIMAARAHRAKLLAENPQLILLAEIRYRDAPKGFIPETSPWWKRDADGKFIMGWAEGGYRLLDVAQEDWQVQVARRAKAIMDTGAFDGVMLDWWTDDASRVSLIRQIRKTIGDDALILVNANDHQIPNTARYVNGLFMECYRTATPEDWNRISETLRWAETNLRPPHINCVETWYHHSRRDFSLMRAVTTLSLTQSDGYCLFADPDDLPTPDHLHDWYGFWDKGLGRPQKAGFKRPDGAWERAFANGTVIYNPAGNPPITVHFDLPHLSRTTGRIETKYTVSENDGDIFLKK